MSYGKKNVKYLTISIFLSLLALLCVIVLAIANTVIF